MRQQGWYKHLGVGRNIRTADLPLSYTKKMALNSSSKLLTVAIDGAQYSRGFVAFLIPAP